VWTRSFMKSFSEEKCSMSELEAREWVEKAETDYKAAIDLGRRRKDPLPEAVCFHCQQCAEKYLKAFLIWHGVPFPKVHDLIALKTLCAEKEGSFELIHDLLESLVGYDVAIRYPGEAATLEDAREAIAVVKQVRQFIRSRLEDLVQGRGRSEISHPH
jgi:HEPN domain-containing protein